MQLDETDVVLVEGEGLRIGCECKRSRSLESVGRSIRDASEQLCGREGLGVVLVSLDQVIPATVIEPTHGPVTETCRARLARVAALASDRALAELRRQSQPHVAMGEAIFGVMFCATFLVSGRARGAGANYFNTRFETHSLANPARRMCDVSMHLLGEIMALGQDRLRELGGNG